MNMAVKNEKIAVKTALINSKKAKIKKTILVAANCPLTVLSAAAKRLRLSNR